MSYLANAPSIYIPQKTVNILFADVYNNRLIEHANMLAIGMGARGFNANILTTNDNIDELCNHLKIFIYKKIFPLRNFEGHTANNGLFFERRWQEKLPGGELRGGTEYVRLNALITTERYSQDWDLDWPYIDYKEFGYLITMIKLRQAPISKVLILNKKSGSRQRSTREGGTKRVIKWYEDSDKNTLYNMLEKDLRARMQ